MNEFELDLDLSNAKESSFSVLPEGRYKLSVLDAEVKHTSDLSGKYLKLTFEVKDGEYDGRKLFDNYNFVNKSPEATEIGLGKIKKLMRVGGLTSTRLTNALTLCGLVVMADVKIKKSEKYGEQNIIKDLFSLTPAENKQEKFENSDIPF